MPASRRAVPLAALTGGWILLLAILFFRERSADAAQLPRLIASFPLPFGPPDARALAASLFGALCAAIVFLSWFGLGTLVARFSSSPDNAPRSWHWAVQLAWGAGIGSLLWLALGLRGALRPAAAWTAVAGALALLAWNLRHNAPRRPAAASRPRLPRLAAFAVAGPVALAAISAAAPPTAKDTLLYHISVPKEYLAAGAIVDVPGNIAQYYALGAEMNGAWAMLLARPAGPRAAEAAFGLTQFAYLPLLALLVFGWARTRGLSRRHALLPVALVVSIPTVYASAASAYNDLALAVYVTLAIAAFSHWWTDPTRTNAVAAGLAIGFAFGVKLLALFVLAPIAVLVLWRLRQAEAEADAEHTLAHVARSAVLLFAVAVAVAAPWLAHTWARTGSPVYPFYINLFGGSAPGWDQDRSYLDQILNARYGGYPKSPADYLLLPLRLSTSAQPEVPRDFDGVLGIAFFAGLPLVVAAAVRRRLDLPVGLAAILAGSFFLAWAFSSQQLRYLLPALPALAIALAAAGDALAPSLRRLLWAATLPGLAVTLSWFAAQNPVAVVAGAETRSAYLTRRLDYYPFYEYANTRLPADARLWLIHMRRDTYHLDRPYLADFRIEDHTFVRLLNDSASAAELRARTRALGVTHVLARLDLLLDPRISTVIDDRLPEAENRRRLAIVREFLLDGEVLRQTPKFALVRLPDRQ